MTADTLAHPDDDIAFLVGYPPLSNGALLCLEQHPSVYHNLTGAQVFCVVTLHAHHVSVPHTMLTFFR